MYHSIPHLIHIGLIGRSHGYKGEFHLVISQSGFIPVKGEIIFIELKGDLVPFIIEQCKIITETDFIICIENGIELGQFEYLKGNKVFSNKLSVRALSPQFLIESGMTLADVSSSFSGKISNVIQGGQLLIEVISAEWGKILIPIVEAMIEKVEDNIIYLRIPEGLIDYYRDEN